MARPESSPGVNRGLSAESKSSGENPLVEFFGEVSGRLRHYEATRRNFLGATCFGGALMAICLLETAGRRRVEAAEKFLTSLSSLQDQEKSLTQETLESPEMTEPFPITEEVKDQFGIFAVLNKITGEQFVFWTDNRDGPGWDIYAQRVAAGALAGALIGNEIPIARGEGDQFSPSAAFDSEGNGVVIFFDTRNGFWDLYRQRIGSNGELIGEPGLILPWYMGHSAEKIEAQLQSAESLASLPASSIIFNPTRNEYFLAVTDRYPGGYDAWGLRLNAEGNSISEPFKISLEDKGFAYDAKVLYNNQNDEYLVYWTARNKICAARVSANGQVLEEFNVSENKAEMPTGIYNEERNEYSFVWKGGSYADKRKLFGRRFAANSQPSSEEFVLGEFNYSPYMPTICQLDSDHDLLTWVKCSTPFELWGQVVSRETGQVLGEPFFIGSPAPWRVETLGRQHIQPAVENNGQGVLATWVKNNPERGDFDIKGRVIFPLEGEPQEIKIEIPINETQAGYVVSNEILGHHLGSHAIWVGVEPRGRDENRWVKYDGIIIFDPSQIDFSQIPQELPQQARIKGFKVELIPEYSQYHNPQAGGEWVLELLNPPEGKDSLEMTYWDLSVLAQSTGSIGRAITSEDILEGKASFILSEKQVGDLQEKLDTNQQIIFRLRYKGNDRPIKNIARFNALETKFIATYTRP